MKKRECVQTSESKGIAGVNIIQRRDSEIENGCVSTVNHCSTKDDVECFNYIDFGDAGRESGWVRSCGICSSLSKFDYASKQRLLRQYAQLSALGWAGSSCKRRSSHQMEMVGVSLGVNLFLSFCFRVRCF